MTAPTDKKGDAMSLASKVRAVAESIAMDGTEEAQIESTDLRAAAEMLESFALSAGVACEHDWSRPAGFSTKKCSRCGVIEPADAPVSANGFRAVGYVNCRDGCTSTKYEPGLPNGERMLYIFDATDSWKVTK